MKCVFSWVTEKKFGKNSPWHAIYRFPLLLNSVWGFKWIDRLFSFRHTRCPTPSPFIRKRYLFNCVWHVNLCTDVCYVQCDAWNWPFFDKYFLSLVFPPPRIFLLFERCNSSSRLWYFFVFSCIVALSFSFLTVVPMAASPSFYTRWWRHSCVWRHW